MKTKTKRQWTQFVAVAAAAVCAVTATFAGVSVNHAEAADGNIAYVYAVDNNWAFDVTNNSFDNSVVMTGDGSYSITITNENSYPASSWTAETTDWGGTIGVIQLVLQNVSTEAVTIDSLVFPNGTFENVEYTRKTGEYREYADASGTKSYLNSAVLTLDNSVFAGQTVNSGESITVNFTIGDAGAAVTTTTTTESAAVTTTTTTESAAAATTTTTVAGSGNSSAETTTTTKAADVTAASTTTTVATAVTLETKIDFSQIKDADGNPCVKIDTLGADSVTVVMKVLTSDTEATLAYQGVYSGKWDDDKYEALPVGTDKIVTHTYEIRDGLDNDALTIASYWPTSVTFQSITLKYDKPPVTTTPTTTTTIAGDKVATETVTVGIKNDDNKEQAVIKLQGKVLAVITAEGVKGSTMSGGFYVGKTQSVTWQEKKIDSSESYTIMFENTNNEAYGTYQLYYNGEKANTKVTYKTYTRYDVSMNDEVNGSDVLALARYLTNDTKTEIQDIIADINEDDDVGMKDAVALVKTLMAAAE